MSDPNADARREAWSRYWAGGALHSCAGSFEGNYSGEVRAFWADQARDWPAGTRVLDLATGNGPLPRLLRELRPDALEIDAVDLAQVRPAWFEALPAPARHGLRFHPGVAAEALPFADGSFDQLISQFGLEYTALSQTLPELRRVLRPGAGIGLVLHAADSLVVAQAREELSHLDWLHAAGLPALARALCSPMARAASAEGRAALAGDDQARRLRDQFNAGMAQAADRARGSPCPDLLHDWTQAVSSAFAAAQRAGMATAGEASLEAWRRAQDDNRLRLQELVACARDAEAALALAAQAGWTGARLQPLHFPGGATLGWGLRAMAPG